MKITWENSRKTHTVKLEGRIEGRGRHLGEREKSPAPTKSYQKREKNRFKKIGITQGYFRKFLENGNKR